MKRFTIQQKVMAAVLVVCIIPLALWTIISARTINREMYAKEVAAAENALNQISMSMKDIIIRSRDNARQLIGDSEIANLIWHEKSEVLMVDTINRKLRPAIERIKFQNNAVLSVNVLHRNRKLFDVYEALQYREDFDDIFEHMMENNGENFTFRKNESDGKTYKNVEWYVYGVGRSGTTVYGIAEFALDSTKLYAAFDLYQPRTGEILLLTDDEGGLIHGKSETAFFIGETYGEAPFKTAGVYDVPSVNFILVSYPIPEMNAALLMCISRDLVCMTRQQTNLMVLAAMVSVAGTLSLAVIMHRLIFKRLLHLSHSMDGIYENLKDDATDHPQKCIDEITHLEHHFDDLILRMQKNTELERQMSMKDLTNEVKPHFICNVLEMLRLQAEQLGQMDMARSIVKINQYFRYSIMMWQADATLANELQEACNYIELVNAMRERKIEYHLSLDEWVELNAENTRIPRMVLQPLIDNAIRHGFRGKEYPLLMVRVYFEESILTMEVEDNGNGMNEEEADLVNKAIRGEAPTSDQYRHVGIRNVIKRIEMFNADEGVLKFETSPNNGTRFILQIRMR